MSKNQPRGPQSKQEYVTVDVNWWWFILGAVVVAVVVLIAQSQRPARPDRNAAATPDAVATADTSALAATIEAQLAQATALPAEDAPCVASEKPQWPTSPEMAIDSAKTYIATLKTEVGDIDLKLFADKAPITVNSFIFLAKNDFYDCVTFHRVLPDFMAQGGDPTGTGTGGPGYEFVNETSADLVFDRAGLLAMANAGPDTNGSQFFITFGPADYLNGGYTIFGEVVNDTYAAVEKIALRDPQTATTPGTYILDVTISEE
jgi:cyclophilin family peptidyl-prolyl cis-trans isomerase